MKMEDRVFRIVNGLEGLSLLLLLLVAMPLRHFTGEHAYVKYAGQLHGMLFLMFCYTLWSYSVSKRWPFQKTGIAFIASCLPFGSFLFDHYLLNSKRFDKV